MMELKFDDVGSLPLPSEVDSENFSDSFQDLDEESLRIYKESLELKINCGVELPSYPQLRDMNVQFLEVFKNQDMVEEPFLVREDFATLPEFEALDMLDMDLPEMKICLTGPLELCVDEFDGMVYEDILLNISESLSRFLDNVMSYDGFDVGLVSIDEPSLGTNPELDIDEDILKKAWDIIGVGSVDMGVHLHSPTFYEIGCKTDEINVIDIPTASTPEYLEDMDPEVLRSFEKKLRIGVTRTDIHSLASEFNEKRDVNIWKNDDAWDLFLESVEPAKKVCKRIEKASDQFGDLLNYVGPDCGLRGVGSVRFAEKILLNTRNALEDFREKYW